MARDTDETLSPDSPEPLYQQVKQFIVNGIRAGEWGENKRLPSENYLVERLNVSRMTVHRALRELKSDGIIVRVPGRGTFVSPEKPHSTLLETQDIAREIRNRGSEYACNVVTLETIKADREIAAALGLKPGDRVFHSVIVHRENDAAVQYEERWINPAVAPGYGDQDFTQRTPHDYLTTTAQMTEVEHILHAVRPDEQVRRFLDLGEHEPCLLLARRTWHHATIATRSFFIYPGERYALGGRYKVMGEPESPVLGSVQTGERYGAGGISPAPRKQRKPNKP